MQYTVAFERAWAMLTEWVASGKFAPRNEEDIQCFLFHGIVVELDTALGVRTKASDVPPVLSSATIWSPIPVSKEIGREETLFRRADHRLPA